MSGASSVLALDHWSSTLGAVSLVRSKVLDLLRLTRVHFQCRLLLAMFARFLDLKNLVHQAISS
jgi:hypothetical protein